MIEKTTHVFFIIVTFTVIIKGESNEQQGPCIGMDCLHGVLMHNDEEQGDKHKAEDQYLRFKSALETKKQASGPKDAAEEFHGALMHGDTETGQHHNENGAMLPEVKSEAGPKDMDKLMHEYMHGDEGVNKHEWDSEKGNNVRRGPLDNEQMMHGLLMHGDADHGEHLDDVKEKDPNKKIGPQDAAELMHGVLMHGDEEQGKSHDHAKDKSVDDGGNKVVGPNGDLHGILMHGDSELGHDHSEEDSKAEHEVFRDASKILDMGLGEDLLKIIDIEKILERDRKEYADWIINNPKFQDESMMGSSYATISDTLLNDIELVKRRYLKQTDDNIENDSNIPPKEDIPFTAEDANSVLESGSHSGEGEDMRHDLELLGSTEPLNARHKVKLALLKAKQNNNE